MQRMVPAFVLAVLLHGLLLGAAPGWLTRRQSTASQVHVITMQLFERTPYPPPAIRSIQPPPPIPPKIPLDAVPGEKPMVNPKPVVPPQKTVIKQPSDQRPAVPIPPRPMPAPAAARPAPAPSPEAPPSVVSPAQTATRPDASVPLAFAEGNAQPAETSPDMPKMVMAKPRYHVNPAPEYPAIARQRGYQGTVVLEVFVSEDGGVGELRIAESSRYRLLDRSAVEAVKGWQFEPGRRGDGIVAMWVRVPVDFRLQ